MNNAPSLAASITCRTSDGCQWQVLPQWQAFLLAHDGLPLERWLSDGKARLIKKRTGRAVYCVHMNSQIVYVKHQQSNDPIRGFIDLARGSAARREWNCMIEARRRGVSTAQPVAFGQRYSRGWLRESYLVTEAITGALPLSQFVLDRIETLPPTRRHHRYHAILDRLARFVATMHQAGLGHHDFHAGNILVVDSELDRLDRPAIYLIDLVTARFSGPLNWTASRDNLIVLHAEWFDRLTPGQKWRFLQTYLRHRPELQHPPRGILVDQLDRGARAHSRRIDRGRDRRALQTNQDFFSKRQPGRRLHAVRDLPEPVAAQWLQQPENILGQALDQPIKISHTTLMVRAELSYGDNPTHIALKRCRPRNIWKSVCDRFRRSRAVRGWYMGHALLARRIATARPLACCDTHHFDRPNRQFPWARWFASRESYLAVEWIEGATNLHLWARPLADRSLDERLRLARECAASLGRLLGRMHSRHVSHRDLKASNLLVDAAGGSLKTWVIDTDGTRIHRHLSARRQAADLARLATSVEAHGWVTRTIRYRFLRAYAEQFPRGDIDKKTFWKAIARKATRQIARKKRRGKPLL